MPKHFKIVFHVEDERDVVVERSEQAFVIGDAAMDLLREVPLLKAALDKADPSDGKAWTVAFHNLEAAKAEAREVCSALGTTVGRFIFLRLTEEHGRKA